MCWGFKVRLFILRPSQHYCEKYGKCTKNLNRCRLKGPHSRSVKPEGFPSGLQKLTVHGGIFGLSCGLKKIRRYLIFWAGFKHTEGKTEREWVSARPLLKNYRQ